MSILLLDLPVSRGPRRVAHTTLHATFLKRALGFLRWCTTAALDWPFRDNALEQTQRARERERTHDLGVSRDGLEGLLEMPSTC